MGLIIGRKSLRSLSVLSLVAISISILFSAQSASASLIGDNVTISLDGAENISGQPNPQSQIVTSGLGPEFSWGTGSGCGIQDEVVSVDVEDSIINITLSDGTGSFVFCDDSGNDLGNPFSFNITSLDWVGVEGIVTGINFLNSFGTTFDTTAQVLGTHSVQINITAPGGSILNTEVFDYELQTHHGVGNPFGEVKKITASDGNGTAFFGDSIAIDDDLMIVGARLDNDIGSAYIFERNQGGIDNWGEVKKLSDPSGQSNDNYGFSVGISGDIAVIGAPNSNSAFVYQKNQGGSNNWGLVTELDPLEPTSQFGASVAVDNKTIVVSSPTNFAAYVFEETSPGTWAFSKKLTFFFASNDHGKSIAIENDLIVIGDNDASGNSSDSGAVFVFERNQGGAENWGQIKQLIDVNGTNNDDFGISVDISGDVIVVGDDGEAPFNLDGQAFVFQRNQGGVDNWGLVKKLTASDAATFPGQRFGSYVGISQPTIVVGAAFGDEIGFNSGAAFVFGRNMGGIDNWGEIEKLTVTDGGEFGSSVDISGDTLVSGATRDADNGSNSGAAYIFQEECNLPTSGIFIVTFDCTMIQSKVAPGNIIVQNNAVITIQDGVTLTIALGNNITIEFGSGVLIKDGGNLQVNS